MTVARPSIAIGKKTEQPLSDHVSSRLRPQRYSLQLHEVDRDSYIAMKRAEYPRQNLWRFKPAT
jgi:hypothetical protein